MRLRPMLGWGVFFFLIAIIAQALPSSRGSYYFCKGKYLVATHKYEAAADAYQQAVNCDPKFARGYIELGSCYIALEKYVEAEDAFKKAVAIEDDSCASCGLGMTYRLQGKTAEAETALRHSIQLDSKDTCPYNQLGRLYYDQENYSSAIETLNQEIKLRPNIVTYHFIANATYYSGKVEESIDLYRKIVKLKPKYVSVYVDYARAFNRLGRHSDAIEVYEQGLKFAPDDVMLHVGLGMTEFGIGNKRAAMEEYRRLLQLDREWAERLLKAMKTKSFEKESENNEGSKTKVSRNLMKDWVTY